MRLRDVRARIRGLVRATCGKAAQENAVPPISVMLKPASSLCNMRCRYCFYHSLANSREMPSHGMMSTDTLANTLKKAFAYADGKPVSLSFQGGEPLLAGKDFFRTADRLIKSLNLKGSPVDVGIQTNGTLIDEEWCAMFRSNGWLVGLSLDGDRAANAYRVDADGEPVFDKVYAAAKLLQKCKVDFNVLCVLTRPTAENIEKVYAFFRRNKFRFLQFIPVLKPLHPAARDAYAASEGAYNAEGSAADSAADGTEEWALTPEAYLAFLKKAFSLYMKDMIDGRYTSVRQFDNFVRLANFGRAEQCGMNGVCSRQFVVEGDGAVYPCDFYCLDEYYMGNVNENDFAELEKTPVAVQFVEESYRRPEKCNDCKYVRMCGGGCKRERNDVDKCGAYREFFDYALPNMKRMR